MHPEKEQEFRLRIRQNPWQATLEPVEPPARPETPPEQFSNPLDLLERLENRKKGGVK